MKYNISGFSQLGMIELGLNADDLNILRWFIDFKDSGNMVKEYYQDENCFYYWISYSGLIEAFPYLFTGCKTEESRKKKLQRLLNGNLSKILKKKIVKKNTGTFTFFSLNEENYKKLLEVKPTGHIYSGAKLSTGQNESGAHWNESVQPKDSSINDSSIIKKEKKKTEIDVLIAEYTTNKILKETIYEFVKFRKSIKSPLTTRALKLALNKLSKLTNNDYEKIAILNESIMNGWKGVFELKNKNVINMYKNEINHNSQSRPKNYVPIDPTM